MIFEEMLSRRGKWLEGKGTLSEIVISSRVRLARNLKNLPFPYRAGKELLKRVSSLVLQAVNKNKYLKNATIIKLDAISSLERQFLLERHLISKELLESPEEKLVIVSTEEMVSIMVNEEDHLRLQSLQSGLQILEAWRLIDKIDTELEKKLEYAFSREWGYLTACPTNTGTGMRASVMVHLAALIMSKRINRVMKSVSQLGFTVRGLYGEGTEVVGGFFQISNSLTLGYSEEILINNLERVIIQVVEQEQKARANLLNKKQAQIEDMIWRAYGILKNARLISSRETLELLSALRLGIHLGIVKDISLKTLNELLIFTQPAHLQKITGGEQKPGERDFKRAEFIRHILRKK